MSLTRGFSNFDHAQVERLRPLRLASPAGLDRTEDQRISTYLMNW